MPDMTVLVHVIIPLGLRHQILSHLIFDSFFLQELKELLECEFLLSLRLHILLYCVEKILCFLLVVVVVSVRNVLNSHVRECQRFLVRRGRL